MPTIDLLALKANTFAVAPDKTNIHGKTGSMDHLSV